MDFEEAGRRYGELKQQRDNGSLNSEEFEAQLEQIMVQDDEGRWWSKHPETGAWYYYDATNWVEGTPPDYKEAAPDPTTADPPTEREPGFSIRKPLVAALFFGKRLLATGRRPSKRLLAAALIAAVLIGTGSAIAVTNGEDGDTAGTSSPPAFTIVSDLPLQGAERGESETSVNAITLALEERGYKAGDVSISYESQDDATEQAGKWDEDKCHENAYKAAQNENVVGWIGPFNSGCAKAQIETLNESGLAMISPNNTYVGLTKPGGEPDEPDKYYPTGVRNYARVVVADDKQGRAGALWMKKLGAKSVYILDDTETYGKGLADQFQKSAKEFGIDVLGHESINRDDANYRSLMERIAQEKPDAIYFGGVTANGPAQLVKDKIKAGMSNDDVIFMGADGIRDQGFIETGGEAAEGVYVTFPAPPPSLLPEKGQDFVRRYEEQFPDSKVEAFTPHAYEAANVLLDAIQRAYEKDGEVTREGVVRELFATRNYDGVLGTWSFDENGDTTLTQLAGERIENGEFGLDSNKPIDVAKM